MAATLEKKIISFCLLIQQLALMLQYRHLSFVIHCITFCITNLFYFIKKKKNDFISKKRLQTIKIEISIVTLSRMASGFIIVLTHLFGCHFCLIKVQRGEIKTINLLIIVFK